MRRLLIWCRGYINPKATGQQIIRVSRFVIVGFGLFMGCLAIILFKIGLSLGWGECTLCYPQWMTGTSPVCSYIAACPLGSLQMPISLLKWLRTLSPQGCSGHS